jgi:hypothetical protein
MKLANFIVPEIEITFFGTFHAVKWLYNWKTQVFRFI